MPLRTEPRITQLQNDPHFVRLLAAQRQLYKEVKQSAERRLVALLVITVAAMILGATWSAARNYVGGLAALAMGTWVAVADLRERQSVGHAAGIQEEFDTGLFQLRWHDFLVDHPAEWTITEAAKRGTTEKLEDWYQPKTISDVIRPLDVIICQRANLDYGVNLHRSYARWLTFALVGGSVGALVIGSALGYSFWNLLFAIVAPLGPVGFAVFRDIQAHRASATGKEVAATKVADLWRRGLADPKSVSDEDCRSAQDCILSFRKTNAHVPDRIYNRLRDRNEAVMLDTCAAMVDEALRRGHGVA